MIEPQCPGVSSHPYAAYVCIQMLLSSVRWMLHTWEAYVFPAVLISVRGHGPPLTEFDWAKCPKLQWNQICCEPHLSLKISFAKQLIFPVRSYSHSSRWEMWHSWEQKFALPLSQNPKLILLLSFPSSTIKLMQQEIYVLMMYPSHLFSWLNFKEDTGYFRDFQYGRHYCFQGCH